MRLIKASALQHFELVLVYEVHGKFHYHDDFVAGGGTGHPCRGVRPGHTEAQGTLSYDVSVYDY